MSGTVMKFGPQWIRTLTDGAAPTSSATTVPTSTNNNNNNTNTNTSSSLTATTAPTTLQTAAAVAAASLNSSPLASLSSAAGGKYKLAEYRYGREEMLALYEQDIEAPEDLRKFAELYSEKIRSPMAITQMSEDEVKLSTRNWNSEAVLRSMNKSAAAQSNSVTGPGGGINSVGGIPGGGGGTGGSAGSNILNDRDNRQLSDRGVSGPPTAAGVLSSSPRGPPGSLARMPPEQRGLLSLNPRGPSNMRNLGRGSNLYIRSQSHDDEGVDDGTGIAGGAGFDSRFGLPGQPSRQPNSLRARFDTSRQAGAPGSKPIDIKTGNPIEGDSTTERRSVFDRLPSKYSVDDKIVRKDVNSRPIQSSGDWRSREWSGNGAGPDGRGLTKGPTEERSWRSSRGAASGTAEDWRSNSNSNTSSWYVRTDDQRNLRASQNQENPTGSGFNSKRDTLRRPSADERQGDEDDDIQPRHRRDSLPEWSIGDPLSGDKVGSFDASGAFREIAREDGSDGCLEKGQQDHQSSGYNDINLKSSSVNNSNDQQQQEWRLKTNNSNSSNTFNSSDPRNLNGVDTSASLSELEKLSLLDRNAIPDRDEAVNSNAASNAESRIKASIDGRLREPQSREMQGRFNNSGANFQNSIHHNQLSSGDQKNVDTHTHSSPPSNDIDPKKSIDNSRSSASPQMCQRTVNQSLPANIQQMLKKQQQTNQKQTIMSAMAGSSNTVQQPSNNDEDGFAHLERAAEIMVAEWTAEEDHESSRSPAYFGAGKSNLSREQQNAQANMLPNNSDPRVSSQAQQQQQQSGEQQTSTNNSSSIQFDSNNQKKIILLPFNHVDSQQWFYRDTQGVIQGPFSGAEMFEWYKAGYFVKELLVRRACDELFYPLGEVIKIWDRIPFAPIPMNGAIPPPITTQVLLQFRAVTKQLEMAAGLNPNQVQVPPNAFGITQRGPVLLHGSIIQHHHQQQQQQQVHQALAAASLNQQNISNSQEQQAGIRQILEATRQHDQSIVQQQQQRAHPGNVLDQNEMQNQLRQLLAQLKNREDFSNLNPQEQQEILVRQFVAARAIPVNPAAGTGVNVGFQSQEQMLQQANILRFPPLFEEDRFRYQQRLELERRQKDEAENQGRFMMEQRMKAEEEKQRILGEFEKRQRKQKEQENEKQRQDAEKERLLKLSQLKQQQLAKQQEEFRIQMQNQQRLQQQQQQEKKNQQAVQLNSIQQQQQQQIERAKKAAQAQQVQQEQQRKTAWSTVSKPDQEPVSLATLQKMQEEEKEKERERQRQLQQQIQSNQQQQQQLQQQLQRQMTWANAAQQSKVAPVKTLAEIQLEEEERLAREKQKKTKVQPTVPNAGVWNNAASHLSWKNPPADS